MEKIYVARGASSGHSLLLRIFDSFVWFSRGIHQFDLSDRFNCLRQQSDSLFAV